MAIIESRFISEIINTFPDMMLIINKYRQIVAVNITLLKAFGVDDPLYTQQGITTAIKEIGDEMHNQENNN